MRMKCKYNHAKCWEMEKASTSNMGLRISIVNSQTILTLPVRWHVKCFFLKLLYKRLHLPNNVGTTIAARGNSQQRKPTFFPLYTNSTLPFLPSVPPSSKAAVGRPRRQPCVLSLSLRPLLPIPTLRPLPLPPSLSTHFAF
jgi:hypothetical protein